MRLTLYHGSPASLPAGQSLKTKTGRADGSITEGGAVYLTDDPAACRRYGTVYRIAVTDPTPYAEALAAVGRKKKGRYTRGVYVAKPSDTEILGIF